MPTAAPKPCTVCSVLVRDGTARCSKHKVAPGSFADDRRGSRHKRGYGTAWDKLRAEILRRDEGTCQPHLAEDRIHRGTHVDHKVNKAQWRRLHGSTAGADDPSNLWCVCADWHRSKTAREGAQAAGLLPGAGAAEARMDAVHSAPLSPSDRACMAEKSPAWHTPGGAKNSDEPSSRTGLPVTFLRAQVSGVGGGDRGGEGRG